MTSHAWQNSTQTTKRQHTYVSAERRTACKRLSTARRRRRRASMPCGCVAFRQETSEEARTDQVYYFSCAARKLLCVPVDRPGRRPRVGSLIARQSGGGEGGGEGSGEGGSAQGRGEASGGKGGGEVGGRAPLPTCRSPSMKIRSPKSPRRKFAPGFRHGLVPAPTRRRARSWRQHQHHDLVDEHVVDRLSQARHSLERERMAEAGPGRPRRRRAARPPPARG